MITFEAIDTQEKAETLRILRNECAEWMTKDTRQIAPEQQQQFFREKIATGLIEGFLMCSDGKPVAYGLLVWDEQGRAWSSTGVSAAERGRGFGRIVTIENVRRALAHGVPMHAEVRQDNAGQQRICRTIGYEVTGMITRDGVAVDVMVCGFLHPAAVRP